MDLQKELSTALSRAMADAVPSTPSGSHKIFVVGQIVVNLQSDDHPGRHPGMGNWPCCGRCLK